MSREMWPAQFPAENLGSELARRPAAAHAEVLYCFYSYYQHGFGCFSKLGGSEGARLLKRALKDIRKHVSKEDWLRAESHIEITLLRLRIGSVGAHPVPLAA